MSINRRHVGLVVRRELLDLRRQRRVFALLFVQPLIFVLLLSAPAFFVQRAVAREQAETFTVAVEGDVDALPGLAAALDRRPLRLVRTDNAANRLSREAAEVGLVVARDAAQQVSAGQPVGIQILTFSTQDASERAAPAVVRRLAEYRLTAAEAALVAAGAPPYLAAPIGMDITDVATTSPEGIRFGLAQALPILLVIQLFGLTTVAEQRLAGAKDRRTLEPLLLLPFRRPDLLTGVGIAAAAIGAVSSILIFVPLTLLLSTAVAAVGRSLVGPAEVAASLVIGALALSLVFTAFGLLLGARVGSSGEGSVFVTLTQLTVFAVVVASPFLRSIPGEGPITLVPVLGPLLVIRDGVGEGLRVAPALMMTAGSAVTAWLLGRRAVRRLGDEQSIVRSTG